MPTILTGAYRLFFPAAAIFAAFSVPVWLVLYAGGDFGPADSFAWHQHEMLFGYLAAVLAGFLLTAIPNWTGRPPVAGSKLLGLFLLWLAGRVAMYADAGETWSAGIAQLFLPALAVVATREVWLAGNRRNFVICGLLFLLTLAEFWALFINMHEGARGGVAIAVILIALIGGRIIPTFSRNWLKAKGATVFPAEFGGVDKIALVVTILAVLVWVATPYETFTQPIFVIAGVLLLVRLLRWRSYLVAKEPLLIGLHIGYLWLPIGFVTLAMPGVEDAAFHAFGAGAIGGMTVVVMTRALLGHSGRPTRGNFVDWAVLASIHTGAALRVAAALMDSSDSVYHAAGGLWSLGFAIFAVKYLPIAFAPRTD